jgi:hypothetical protein
MLSAAPNVVLACDVIKKFGTVIEVLSFAGDLADRRK